MTCKFCMKFVIGQRKSRTQKTKDEDDHEGVDHRVDGGRNRPYNLLKGAQGAQKAQDAKGAKDIGCWKTGVKDGDDGEDDDYRVKDTPDVFQERPKPVCEKIEQHISCKHQGEKEIQIVDGALVLVVIVICKINAHCYDGKVLK